MYFKLITNVLKKNLTSKVGLLLICGEMLLHMILRLREGSKKKEKLKKHNDIC